MKTLIIKFVISSSLFLPSLSSAADTGGGMDMEVYSIFLSYGFFVMVAVFFGYLIYCSTHPKVYHMKKTIQTGFTMSTQAGFEKIVPALNAVYYIVLILMVLYAVIFMIQLL